MPNQAIPAKTAFQYVRVSTPRQQVNEQVVLNRGYADTQGINIIGQYGDYGKRHKASQRKSFQAMLTDITTMKPNYILIHRLDRFGVADPNQLGYFLEVLRQNKVRLITTADGKDRSKIDLATMLENVVGAAQSRQEQIDKAERVLTGKRKTALSGEYIGGKYLAYGFDLLCIGQDGTEMWRLVEDAYDCRVKYTRDHNGDYVEVRRYDNVIVKDPEGIMEDKVERYRPKKEKGEKLYYSPSIRTERIDTLRRVCQWFADGWTTYRIAQQLHLEGSRPLFAPRWYSALIDGILDNTVLIGRPAWNRTSQASFREISRDGTITEPGEDEKRYRVQGKADWLMPDQEVFEPIIPLDLFTKIQDRMEARKQTTPKRSPRSETLWFGSLWVDEDSDTKMAGDARQKIFRVKDRDHQHKRLTFKEAERFIAEYLDRVGQRVEVLGEAVESNNLLNKLSTEEWLAELKLDRVVMEVEDFLAARLKPGQNKVAGVSVALDQDDEGHPIITTDGDYLLLYCEMVNADMQENRQAVQEKMEERDRLVAELMGMKNKNEYIMDAYSSRIDELSREIQKATNPVDYKAWYQQVVEEVELIRQQQEHVRQSIQTGTVVQRADAIRRLIDRIVVHWTTEPTTDRRHKDGVRTFCRAVTVYPVGEQHPTMTIETPLAWSCDRSASVTWLLANPRLFVRQVLRAYIPASAAA